MIGWLVRGGGFGNVAGYAILRVCLLPGQGGRTGSGFLPDTFPDMVSYIWLGKKGAMPMEPSWLDEYVRDQEYMEYVNDILRHPVFQSMDQYIQHGTTTCKSHCIQVSYLGYKICKRFGGNSRSAARAGLLHDLFLYDWHTHARDTGRHFHGFTHPREALRNAGRHFDLSREEEMIILRHMWPLTPVPPVTKAGYAITCADKLCSTLETTARLKHWMALCCYTSQPDVSERGKRKTI